LDWLWFVQALKQGQLPSDFVLPGDDVLKIPVAQSGNLPLSSIEQLDDTTAMEEVLFS
jgi:hypothetical protein